VLLFRHAAGGDFANGQAATTVFGQTDFSTITGGSTNDKMSCAAPHCGRHLRRLYVATA